MNVLRIACMTNSDAKPANIIPHAILIVLVLMVTNSNTNTETMTITINYG